MKDEVSLRPLREADAPVLWSAVDGSRARLKRWLRWVPRVKSVDDCAAFIRGRSALGVFESAGGALVGVAALREADEGVAEAGLWIASDFRGRGFAAQAGKALLANGFGAGLRRIYCRIEPSNRAARRVAQDLGFRYEGRLRKDKKLNGRWVDQECWGLLKEEWKRR